MTDDQMAQLRRHLAAIHERFADLVRQSRMANSSPWRSSSRSPADNVLAIKQARPWIFTALSTRGSKSYGTGDTDVTTGPPAS